MEILSFDSAEAFETWLAESHASSDGIWLKLRKKVPGSVALDYVQALDVALCHGWIDGQKGQSDDGWWLQRFTPQEDGRQVVRGQQGQGRGADLAGREAPSAAGR